jgi:hypothetical protein
METIKKIMDILFLITMVLYIGISAVIVFGQAFAILSLDGSLCLWFKEHLLAPACVFCGCTGLISFGMSYIYKWKSNE